MNHCLIFAYKYHLIQQVISVSNRLAQEAWVTTQQRINLNKLIMSNPDCTPADCCEIAHQLDDAHFVEAHESIGYDASHLLCHK